MQNRQRFVAGADGCAEGWVVALLQLDGEQNIAGESCQVLPSFKEVLGLPEEPRYVGVDMPIGLPDHALPGGRECDRVARQLLGAKRGTSVFDPPVRAVLSAQGYDEAVVLNRASSRHFLGLSKQSYSLLPKLREVHDEMTQGLQMRVREVHPEVSFLTMNDGLALNESKSSQKGRKERLELLGRDFSCVEEAIDALSSSNVTDDDVLDAYAAAWSAWRMARKKARYIPEDPEIDSRGLRMGIWY